MSRIDLRGYVTPNAYSAVTEDVTEFGPDHKTLPRFSFVRFRDPVVRVNLIYLIPKPRTEEPDTRYKNLRLAPLGQSNCGFCGFLWLENTFSGGQSLSQPILICGSAHSGGVRASSGSWSCRKTVKLKLPC